VQRVVDAHARGAHVWEDEHRCLLWVANGDANGARV
jgi:hypothetical protein